MKRFISCTLLVVAFGVYNHVQAQFKNSEVAYGFSAGGAQGTNNGGDNWVMQYRGFLQVEFISPLLIGQLGVGYTDLNAPGVYSAQTGIADLRLLFSPFSLSNLNPYLYGGFGVSKALISSGTDYLPMVPFGAGIQTRISSQVLLEISGGYNLSLSDKLDGRERANTDLNTLTNQKHDGFFGFSIGLAFTLGHGYDAAEELKKKELADAEARRVKQQADADTEARRVKESTDAEARRVKELADAEARRVKQQADADAEARRVKDSTDAVARSVKESTDAEARRVKELADAEARRLAEQKVRDNTIIILEKGKKVVLKGVTFETGKGTLRKESETILTMAYNALVANPDVQVEISGHTDNVGSQKSNQVLSLKRAQAVRNWLVQKGIVSNRMKAVGKGQNEPVSSNATDAGRAENRRIEFYVQQ
ncbi:MAG: OmpA family protein [Ignavibacteria bacterium]|nr:OmpA family protein [Ignavibacteria bacterium]